MNTIVKSFGDLQPDEYLLARGKGRALAQLYQAGYLVPDVFIIFPGAFRDQQIIQDAWQQIEHHLGRLRDGNRKLLPPIS